jgi:hypothetical protein
MFSTTYVGWKTLYGTWEGDGIYSMVFVVRNREGALPKGLTYEHFEMAREGKDVDGDRDDGPVMEKGGRAEGKGSGKVSGNAV